MLEWSVATLRGVREIERIVVALPADALDAAPIGTVAVAGGAVRSESVRAALAASPGGDPIVVHDAARPLAPAELFERALFALEASGVDAVIAAARVSDTIKQVATDARTVERTLERSRLWAVQTPQVFRREALVRALFDADHELLAKATDDAWLVERGGGSVQVVEAAPGNIKITTPTDLKLAELLLAEGAE
jgi:2-C-methyl-D-erythritol 4-phosphate cytidylyltransferase